MKIKYSKPPNYKKIAGTFDIRGRKTVFTYDDTCYISSGIPPTQDLLEHEQTHMHQQRSRGAEAWWDKYLTDPGWRAIQEIEAYRAQYQYAIQFMARPNRRKLLRHCVSDLSGPMYGNMMTEAEAEAVIKQGQHAKD